MAEKALTDRQRRFCEEYLIDLNGTAAYMRAGYKVRSSDVARANAARLLATASVEAYVTELQQRRSRRTRITADRVIKELARIATSDITNVASFSNNGVVFYDSKGLKKGVTAAIESISFTETIKPDGSVTVKKGIKMHSKQAAIRNLSEHLGILTPDLTADTDPVTGLEWERIADGESMSGDA